MSILDALSKHSMFSETLDTLNRDPSTAHQMKGFDFAQNFPGAVPGGVYTPTSFLGPMISKGYQYGQEIGNALLDGPGGYTLGQAIDNAGIQSDANIEGMLEKGFDMNTYNQNVKDFNIADVNFANSFGLDNLFGSSAMANEPTVNVDSIKSAINAARNREALDRQGLLSLDDAGLTTPAYENFAQVAKPGFNFNRVGDFLTDLKDTGKEMFGSGKNFALKGLGSIFGGPMGGAIGSILGSITDKFENRPLAANVIDEFGNVYDFNDLNKQNALGGYHTDAARSARRRSARIANMLERQKLGKTISLRNLAKLQAQEKAQEAEKQAAANRMQAQNKAAGTGGYQAGYGSDFMDGPSGAGTGLGASDKGGSDSMGSS